MADLRGWLRAVNSAGLDRPRLASALGAACMLCGCQPAVSDSNPANAVVEIDHATDGSSASPSMNAVLPLDQMSDVLRQCSRPTPQAESYWSPTQVDLERLETGLPAFVRANAHPLAPDQWKDLADYARQYVGLVRNGRRFIYANLFRYPEIGDDWLSTPIVVCDGGPAFFGVEYDIQSGSFTHIEYNGVI